MRSTWTLTGFGDEIDPEPRLQFAVLAAVGASYVEFRGAWETNVLDLTSEQLDAVAAELDRASVRVSSVASPVGKSPVTDPVDVELGRLDRAISVAHRFDCPFIRVFSFYPAPGQTPAQMRDGVLERLSALAARAAREGVTLLHENEKEIYGDVPERVLDIVESVGSPSLRLVWDAANYVQSGIAEPHTQGYALLREHVAYLHVKDAKTGSGEIALAGQGDGQLDLTIAALHDDGFAGFASLEPHLQVAGHSTGFSGPRGFGQAARALRALTDRAGIALS